MTPKEQELYAHEVLARKRRQMVKAGLDPFDTRASKLEKLRAMETVIAPPPFKVQIPLIDVFEILRKVKADEWQRNFCQRLQDATVNKHIKGIRAIVHAQPQLGKSVILAQAFPLWLMGHDPLHRIALATYNVTRSQRHASVVIRMMQSREYKAMFSKAECQLTKTASQEGFCTQARHDLADAQLSLNPMGLQSGFVGSGADTLIIDDPYKEAKEAYSETIRENIEVFWDETSNTRINEFTNVFGMFHRYHQADLAGYLLAAGEFDYWRYATECDGDYIDDETGLVYPDPMQRELGELISPRYSEYYYQRQKGNPKTWYSQFQGRPTGEEGNTFNVKKILVLDPIKDAKRIVELQSQVMFRAMAWDNAASEEEGSAFTAGIGGGWLPTEEVLIDDVRRARVNTAERYEMQLEAAKDHGHLAPILVPQDPGSAGKDTAFQTKRMLEEERFTCFTEPVSGSKEVRAQPFSLAVNSGKVIVALEENVRREFFKELKNFPLSTYKDQVDAASDLYRYLYKTAKSGLVVKGFSEQRNLVSWSAFADKFGNAIPEHWKIYVACRISEDASKPSGGVAVAHAAQNSGLKDTLFLFNEFKQYTGSSADVLEWAKKIKGGGHILVSSPAESLLNTVNIKLGQNAMLFKGDNLDGLSEMNWFIAPRAEPHPFNTGEQGTGLYILKDEGMSPAVQECVTWRYNDKGEPQEHGGIVLDCLRMITHRFKTQALPLSSEERREKELAEKGLAIADIENIESEAEKLDKIQLRRIEIEAQQKKKAQGSRIVAAPLRMRRM